MDAERYVSVSQAGLTLGIAFLVATFVVFGTRIDVLRAEATLIAGNVTYENRTGFDVWTDLEALRKWVPELALPIAFGIGIFGLSWIEGSEFRKFSSGREPVINTFAINLGVACYLLGFITAYMFLVKGVSSYFIVLSYAAVVLSGVMSLGAIFLNYRVAKVLRGDPRRFH